MTDRELRRLSCMELIQILLEQTRETERLQEEVEELRQQLDDRRIQVGKAGSIAEASVQLSRVMEAAQRAADQYLENTKRMYNQQMVKSAREVQAKLLKMERDTKARCAEMLKDAQKKAKSNGETS